MDTTEILKFRCLDSTEFRRTIISKDSSYEGLKFKLVEMFPELKGQEFFIKYSGTLDAVSYDTYLF